MLGFLRKARTSFQRLIEPGSRGWQPQLQLGFEGVLPQPQTDGQGMIWGDAGSSVVGDIFDGILNMAVPKSKISKSKKRIKYQRYMAKQIRWQRCDRCGEPKLPHRMCEENKEICSLSENDYKLYQVQLAELAEKEEEQ